MFNSCELSYQLISDYYCNNRNQLIAYINKRIGNVDDAEDILQNGFLRLLQSDKMISEVTLPCLVYTVVSHLIIDYYRKHSCYQKTSIDNTFDLSDGHSSDTCVIREMYRSLEEQIASLPEDCQRIYKMNLYEGIKPKDIAIRMDIDYKKIDNTLAYARNKVRGYMKQFAV